MSCLFNILKWIGIYAICAIIVGLVYVYLQSDGNNIDVKYVVVFSLSIATYIVFAILIICRISRIVDTKYGKNPNPFSDEERKRDDRALEDRWNDKTQEENSSCDIIEKKSTKELIYIYEHYLDYQEDFIDRCVKELERRNVLDSACEKRFNLLTNEEVEQYILNALRSGSNIDDILKELKHNNIVTPNADEVVKKTLEQFKIEVWDNKITDSRRNIVVLLFPTGISLLFISSAPIFFVICIMVLLYEVFRLIWCFLHKL